MALMTNICFQLSKRRALRNGQVSAESAVRFDRAAYQEWRDTELHQHLAESFEAAQLAGRDVLDFGCGAGDLSFFIAEMGAKSVTGIELDDELIVLANARLKDMDASAKAKLRFILGTDSKKVEAPDNSADVIICFDVLEHILDYVEVIAEWRRVLRDQGEVFIWWMPWLHPYGHHIRSLVPLPWAHVVFSDKVLIETCARIYDLPDYKPRLWDKDENGNKKPNKWLTTTTLPTLNRLTIARFEKVCRDAGLKIAERRVVPFSQLRSLAGKFARIVEWPVLREFFCSHVVYRLRKEN
jgi:ubiquinone/menaquinone biosynthesis C-methylase UbiE